MSTDSRRDATDELLIVNSDPHELACRIANVLVLPSACVCSPLDAADRAIFWTAMLAAVSGMAEHSIGHAATRRAINLVCEAVPVDAAARVKH